MGATAAQPNPDLVHDLFWGNLKPQFIRLDLQLEIFNSIAAGLTIAE